MTVIPSVQWHGCITQGATALRWSGNGNGGRVTLDIPDTEGAAFDDLRAMTEREIIITIIAADDAADVRALPFADGNGHPPPPPAHDPSTTGVA